MYIVPTHCIALHLVPHSPLTSRWDNNIDVLWVLFRIKLFSAYGANLFTKYENWVEINFPDLLLYVLKKQSKVENKNPLFGFT